MAYRGPKAKLSRRLGVALTPKADIVMQKKPYAPGQHGQRRRPAQSEYGKQLVEKQRLKFQYNVSEREMRRYFKMAKKRKGSTPAHFVSILEHRLDNVVRRSGLAPTIYAARQLVSHKHITVNGKVVNKPNVQIGPEDIVGVKEKSKDMGLINESINNCVVPAYMELNRADKAARFIRPPELNEIPITCDSQLVVEYYSR